MKKDMYIIKHKNEHKEKYIHIIETDNRKD